ncbi:MAG: sigma 54-interacting transcriptional regulator [Clostridium sp.]|nr:sigma 54-interacting transcriptional regulator [Clostridium sp.]
MTQLESVRSGIEHFVSAAAEAFRVEAAVFNQESSLFFCTPTYLKKKGNAVHYTFIQDVIVNGSVLVTEPGKMPSCIGCRFNEHCPSTMEILCCIHSGTEVAGVISFTSFTKEGQKRISENTDIYLNAITKLSSLIGEYLQQFSGDSTAADTEKLIESLMSLCEQPLLLTDPNGVVLRYNQLADKILKFCNVSSTSLRQIFSEDMARRITSGNDLFEKKASIGENTAKVTTRSIYSQNHLHSILVRLSNEFYENLPESGAFERLIGSSHAFVHIQNLIKRVADSPTPILITGETGTGKELVARSFHEQSRRNKYPFVAINCSSIPENLFESELFGYEEGSFTGAKKGGKMGRIEMAQGGTLFLDELGEMPLSVQPKLLRVLQEYELERVGSTKKIHLDIRIVAATNRDLREMIKEGKFREDLFYRISVINVKLPPLRERKEDIIPISLNYLERLKTKMTTPLCRISPEAEQAFLSYSWPGNIRELQNVVEYAANLCDSDTLTLADLPEHLHGLEDCPAAEKQKESPLPDSQEKQILDLLSTYGHTLEGKKKIAADLGISLRTLYRKLNKMNL